MTDLISDASERRFLGLKLQRLVDLLVDQGQELFAHHGARTPVRTASTFVVLSRHPGASLADIARELDQPHQLVAQRIHLMMKEGFVVRRDDPRDGRRKAYYLTKRGREEFARVERAIADGARAVEDLNDELGVDLFDIVERARRSLNALDVKARAARFAERRGEADIDAAL